MAQIAPGTLGVKGRNGQVSPDQTLVCGDCGCVVADEHVATHVAFHAQTAAAAFPKTVTSNVPAGVR
jgi:transcription initiation factor TFIIIB Brf1 subunit/transcription initiation factor TFIIB